MGEQLRSISAIFEDRPIRFRVLQLRFMHKMSHREICEDTGLSRKAVRFHIHAALRRLERHRGYVFDLDQNYSE